VVDEPSGPPEWAAKETSLSDVVQLTGGFERAGEAYFSADGNWVIFQAAARGEAHYQMYVAKLRRDGDRITGTETPVRISPPNSRNTCGYFSPDGRSLIFASTAGKEDPNEPAAGYQRQGGNYRWDFPNGMEIYRADDWQAAVEEAMKQLGQVEDRLIGAAPGSGSRTNLHDSYAFVDLAKKAITANVAYDAEGAFSPDGKWIVFGSRRDGDSELYVMRPDGSGAVRLTHTPGYDGGPFFSPDGKRIVYRSDRKGNDLLQVFTAELKFSADGAITGIRNEKKLTDDANVNWGPYWHPDGKHIIYATSAHGHTNYELYWMNDDGTGKTRITYAPGFDGLPAFSADGKYLMWSSKRSKDNTTQVFAARFKAPG
jgi:Tol biopolymer transport system component